MPHPPPAPIFTGTNFSQNVRGNVNKTIYSNGEIFYGVLTESQRLRQGFGELHKTNGKVLIGEWDLDHLNGVGIITYQSGKELICNFSRGLKFGIGEIKIGNRVYRGQFQNNKRTGVGIFVDKGVETRRGTFINGEHHGYGEVEIKSSGNSYMGYFADGKPNGMGIERTQFDTYIGNFENGRKNGLGKLVEKDGFEYTG